MASIDATPNGSNQPTTPTPRPSPEEVAQQGAELARMLWEHRVAGLDERGAEVLAYHQSVEAAGRNDREKDPAKHAAGLLGSCAAGLGDEPSVVELAARAARTVRFLLSSGVGMDHDFDVKANHIVLNEDDVRDTLYSLENDLEKLARMLRLEGDAAVLAIHAAARGLVPEMQDLYGRSERAA